MTEGVKGKHFFLETDVKGPTLKLDNTGKAIFTVSYISFGQSPLTFVILEKTNEYLFLWSVKPLI